MNKDVENALGAFAAYEASKDIFNHATGFITFIALLVGLKTNSKKVRNAAIAIGAVSAIDEIRMMAVAFRARKNAIEMTEDPEIVKDLTSIGTMLSKEKDNWKHQMALE